MLLCFIFEKIEFEIFDDASSCARGNLMKITGDLGVSGIALWPLVYSEHCFCMLLSFCHIYYPHPEALLFLSFQVIIESFQGLAETSEEQVFFDQLVDILDMRHFLSFLFELSTFRFN